MTTAFLLDFDDVFNICSPTGIKHMARSGWDRDRWQFAEHKQYGVSFPIHYNEEAVKTANNLAGGKIWLTTWTHDYLGRTGLFGSDELDEDLLDNKRFLESIGFGKFDSLDAPGDYGIVWKVRAVQWLFKQGMYDRIVWFDDQLTRINGKAVLKSDAEEMGIDFVGITVRPGLGITKKELTDWL